MTISYEAFAGDTEGTIRELERFLGLNTPIAVPIVKGESLRRWEVQLSNRQIEEIQSVVGVAPAAEL